MKVYFVGALRHDEVLLDTRGKTPKNNKHSVFWPVLIKFDTLRSNILISTKKENFSRASKGYLIREKRSSEMRQPFIAQNQQEQNSLTLSPMGSNPTDLLWGGPYGPPYVKRLELEIW